MSEQNPLAVDLVSAALVKCQGSVKAAEFDATNPFFKSRYATLGSVIEASREALVQSGLAVLQVPTIDGGLVSVHTRIVHSSGQSLDCGSMSLSLGESDRNSDAQLAGSILTYLKRYAWASILGIYADTDDDGHSAPKGAIPRQKPVQASGPPVDTTQGVKVPEKGIPASNSGTKESETAQWAKLRMKLLNKLEAAPGQKNRVLLTDFLTAEGILTTEQVLEDLPTSAIPTTPEAFDKLLSGMQDFDMKRSAAEAQTQ